VTRITFTAGRAETGERLDRVVTRRLESLSRSRVQELIDAGHVTVNGLAGRTSLRLAPGDQIVIDRAAAIVSPDYATATLPEAIPLDVIYEDDAIVGINKAAGMVVHPAAAHPTGTLVNALLARWPQMASVGGENRAGIVHRLDKDTSGAMAIAKTEPARLALMAQFEAHTDEKRYLALVEGIPAKATGIIDAAIGPDPRDSKRMAITPRGLPATTAYRVLERYAGTDGSYALVEALPRTGRTHQIRVHLAYLGHPLVGDALYGLADTRFGLSRHFLHADSLRLTSPASGQMVTLHAPLSSELAAVIARLKGESIGCNHRD